MKHLPVKRAFNRLIKLRFDELGIEIPFPHQTVFFGEEKSGSAAAARVSIEQPASPQIDPATLAEDLDADAWSPLSAGEGAKGPRLYEWARLPIGFSKNNGFERWLLFRSLAPP